jgi:hypothetical protein
MEPHSRWPRSNAQISTCRELADAPDAPKQWGADSASRHQLDNVAPSDALSIIGETRRHRGRDGDGTVVAAMGERVGKLTQDKTHTSSVMSACVRDSDELLEQSSARSRIGTMKAIRRISGGGGTAKPKFFA